MSYLFPYEDVFVGIISLMIVGLLLLRWYVTQNRKK